MQEIKVQGVTSGYLPTGLFKCVAKVDATEEVLEFFKDKVCNPVNLIAEISDESDTGLWASDAALFQPSFDQLCALLGHIGGEFWNSLNYPCLIFIGAVEFRGEIKILTVEKVRRNFPFSVKLELKSFDEDWEIFNEVFPEIFHIFVTAVQDKYNSELLIPIV